MKLQIEVPDETWGITVVLSAINGKGGNSMFTTILRPEDKVTILWKDKKHETLVDIKE